MTRTYLFALSAVAAAATLFLPPACEPATAAAAGPAVATAVPNAPKWKGCDLSAFSHLDGAAYSEKSGTPAVFSQDFSLPTTRLVQISTTARAAQEQVEALRDRTDDDARYQHVSTIREEDRSIYLYAHAGEGGYDEILTFGISEEENTILQLLGKFSTDDLLAVVRQFTH